MTEQERSRAVSGTVILAACFLTNLFGMWLDSLGLQIGAAIFFGWAFSHFDAELDATLWPWMRGDRRTFFPPGAPPEQDG